MHYMNNMNDMNDMKIKFNLVKMKHQCVIITFVIKLDEIFRKNRIRRNELSRNNWWLDLCVFFMWIFVKIKNSLSKLWLNQMWKEKRVSWWMAHGCGVQRKVSVDGEVHREKLKGIVMMMKGTTLKEGQNKHYHEGYKYEFKVTNWTNTTNTQNDSFPLGWMIGWMNGK